uniref:Pantothenate kinase n=1 Tax=Haptolina brevifila TaxID=156173 RepID=A0A7S2JQP1_9EUKA|mmetsp:Transcript_87276/g.174309  ORF Transcript_87276/g.174309 Transcript_87276/m.174309 type:complete len:603 (+) Transcript_87276:52-1860(+)
MTRSTPLAEFVALFGVAATLVWLMRRHRRLEGGRTATSVQSEATQLKDRPSTPARASSTPLPTPTPRTLSRVPSRVQLDSTSARFGLDIGGSLTKFIYLEQDDGQDDVVLAKAYRDPDRAGLEPELSVEVPALGGRLHFAHFQTAQVEKTVNMLKRHHLCDGVRKIHATGGGAHKYRRLIESTLHTKLSPCNELEAVVLGICLMSKSVNDECYTLEAVSNPSHPGGEAQPQSVIIPPEQLGIAPLQRISKPFCCGSRDEFFPFLLCNVGTGVSILHVESERSYTRVSGTAVGGGTFMGLTRLLTRARGFQEALDVAASGDARRVDMLVSDIYGSGQDRAGLNLPGDLTASFFAKNMETADDADPRGHVQDDDICKALVVMIAQNVAQICHLNARIHSARRVFFTGNFLRHNGLALRTIVYTMQRWSQLDRQRGAEPTEAIFFRHEGYFGAIGAFLQTLDSEFVSDLDFSSAPAETPPASSTAASAPCSASTSTRTSASSSPRASRTGQRAAQPTPAARRTASAPQSTTSTPSRPTASTAPQHGATSGDRGGSATAAAAAAAVAASSLPAQPVVACAMRSSRGSPKGSPKNMRKAKAVAAPSS